MEEKYSIEDAVSEAMDSCIRKGILEEILRNHREEVRSMVLTEYDEQAHIKNEREIALKEGEEKVSRLMQLLLESGRTQEALQATLDVEYRELLYKEYHM